MAAIEDIAYVLVYKDEDDEGERAAHTKWREFFKVEIRGAELEVEEIDNPNDDKEHMILISAQFNTLAKQAEKMRIQMPLDYVVEPKQPENAGKTGCGCTGCCDRCRKRVYGHFDVDKETEDFIAKEFVYEDFDIYRGKDDTKNFFRPALKSLLVYNILIELDINSDEIKELGLKKEEMGDSYEKGGKKRGLLYLRLEDIYTDDFPLHDPSVLDRHSCSCCRGGPNPADDPESPSKSLIGQTDERKLLYDSWTRLGVWFKFQPMWRIRDYFGEKVAFYFAWCGHLIASLWIPAIVGLAIFFYGLRISILRSNGTYTATTTPSTSLSNDSYSKVLANSSSFLEDALAIIRESFDNNASPFFSLLICIWATFFTETWSRRSAQLAYEWDVDDYEENEPDRPEYDHRGTIARRLPGSSDIRRIVPGTVKFRRYMISFLVLLIMIVAVCLSVAGVILFRIAATVAWFPTKSQDTYRFLTASIAAPVMNAVSMILLQFVYNKLADILTRWENHRTQTEFNDSLILKMFCFQFINSYASLFYIAFFQNQEYENGIFGQGPAFRDSCGADGKCMSQLSFQLLVMMIVKPIPKFCFDVIIPIALKLLRRCCKRNSTGPMKKVEDPRINFIMAEKNKTPLDDFTVMEYCEKVIQFGYVMLFAASFPLAPLIAIITDMCDIRVDSGRLLRLYRRPVPFIAQDIGMWEKIVRFLSLIGVVSNAFLIGFTSEWGMSFGNINQLWIVIGFEHICIIVKYIVAFIIPDIPSELKDTMADEEHWADKKVADFREMRDGIKKSSVKLQETAQPEASGRKSEPEKKPKDQDGVALLPPSYHETNAHAMTDEQRAEKWSESGERLEKLDVDRDNDYKRDEDLDGVPRQRLSPRKKKKKKKKKQQELEMTEDAPGPLPPFDRQLLRLQDAPGSVTPKRLPLLDRHLLGSPNQSSSD